MGMAPLEVTCGDGQTCILPDGEQLDKAVRNIGRDHAKAAYRIVGEEWPRSDPVPSLGATLERLHRRQTEEWG